MVWPNGATNTQWASNKMKKKTETQYSHLSSLPYGTECMAKMTISYLNLAIVVIVGNIQHSHRWFYYWDTSYSERTMAESGLPKSVNSIEKWTICTRAQEGKTKLKQGKKEPKCPSHCVHRRVEEREWMTCSHLKSAPSEPVLDGFFSPCTVVVNSSLTNRQCVIYLLVAIASCDHHRECTILDADVSEENAGGDTM